ncbi:V-ATPase V1 sector subunit E [Serendipita sp. 411]|nr:V-ATPase V1 sector subunit E [Serendipita sp. 398]KAG8848306.1 V-ATPase V1 sector subunit E [Serendipita sp. 411]
MNDEEVASEMNKMIAFIKQEAMEKAREVKVKADEEFAIEKAKIVRQESQAIDAAFDKKRKAAETALKIAQSTQTNRSRLRLLQAREQYLGELFNAAREELLTLSKDEGRYVQLLEDTITQSLLQLMEADVTVHSRPQDTGVVQRAVESASGRYKDVSGRKVNVQVEGSLSKDCAGGVRLIAAGTKIMVDNTLDERLKLLEEKMLPEIRHELFGINENRKFYT